MENRIKSDLESILECKTSKSLIEAFNYWNAYQYLITTTGSQIKYLDSQPPSKDITNYKNDLIEDMNIYCRERVELRVTIDKMIEEADRKRQNPTNGDGGSSKTKMEQNKIHTEVDSNNTREESHVY